MNILVIKAILNPNFKWN